MATFKIREFTRLGQNGLGQIAQEPGTDQTAVTFTSSSVQSAAFASDTAYIMVKCDVDVCYVVGANPTATQNAMHLESDTEYFMGVPGGAKIAVITKT